MGAVKVHYNLKDSILEHLLTFLPDSLLTATDPITPSPSAL